MLSFVNGRVVEISGNRITVQTGGFGLDLLATPRALSICKVDGEVRLPVSMIIREDAWQLFGFADSDEKAKFELLQTVSGVGPKLALTIISALGADEFARAIAEQDEARLTRVPGVGKKSAARLIVELSGRLPQGSSKPRWQDEVFSALRSLGWTEADSDWAVNFVQGENPSSDTASALREALAALGRERRK